MNPNKYFGVEPNAELVIEGLDHEVGHDIINIKHPLFFHNDGFKFSLPDTNPQFDFILAQSIFTHATKQQINICIHNAAAVMHKDSIFVATYFNAVNGALGDSPQEWTYPSVVKYPYLFMKKVANEADLTLEVLDKYHPVGQTWIILRKVQ